MSNPMVFNYPAAPTSQSFQAWDVYFAAYSAESARVLTGFMGHFNANSNSFTLEQLQTQVRDFIQTLKTSLAQPDLDHTLRAIERSDRYDDEEEKHFRDLFDRILVLHYGQPVMNGHHLHSQTEVDARTAGVRHCLRDLEEACRTAMRLQTDCFKVRLGQEIQTGS